MSQEEREALRLVLKFVGGFVSKFPSQENRSVEEIARARLILMDVLKREDRLCEPVRLD